MCEKDWIDITTALFTPIVALLGVTFAYFQLQINRNRLKHELFKRRNKMFDATRTFLGTISMGNRVQKETIFSYQISITGVRFVFDKKTAQYMKNLCSKVIELRKYQNNNDTKKEHELLTWLDQEFYKLEDRFMDSMSIYF